MPMNIRGAVDLGALAAARENASSAQRAAAQRAANPALATVVRDVTTATFEQEVIAQSMQVPVVIDLWAAWCGPCKTLSPILEKLAVEYGGRWVLAKIDVDAEPAISQAFQVQSIPSVFVAIKGQVMPLFQGAVPEQNARQIIEAVLAEAANQGVAGQLVTDESVVLETAVDPRYEEAESAIEQADWEKAASAYRKLLAESPADPIAKVGLLNVALFERTDGMDVSAIAKLETQDHETALRKADALLLLGDFAGAFAVLLDQVRRESGDLRNTARDRLLEFFEIAGPDIPEVAQARRSLASALY